MFLYLKWEEHFVVQNYTVFNKTFLSILKNNFKIDDVFCGKKWSILFPLIIIKKIVDMRKIHKENNNGWDSLENYQLEIKRFW